MQKLREIVRDFAALASLGGAGAAAFAWGWLKDGGDVLWIVWVPISTFLILLPVISLPAIFYRNHQDRKASLRLSLLKDAGDVSREIRNAVQPEMLSAASLATTNFEYMRDEAARSANQLAPRLRRNQKTRHLLPSDRCKADDDESLRTWAEALEHCVEAII